MLGLGWAEILVLLVVGIIFIGPKQLPGLIRGVAKFLREVTKARDDWMRSVQNDDDLRDIKRSFDEVKASVNEPISKAKEAIQKVQLEAAIDEALEKKKDSNEDTSVSESHRDPYEEVHRLRSESAQNDSDEVLDEKTEIYSEEEMPSAGLGKKQKPVSEDDHDR